MTVTRMQQKRGSGSEWAAANPILADGEIGYDETAGIIKIGDGLNVWSELSTLFDAEYSTPGSLTDAIAAEVTRANAAYSTPGALTAAIAAEVTRANAAYSTPGALTAAIAAEVTRANAAYATTTEVIQTREAPLSPFNYGAVGDGVADDTAAINAAILAASQTTSSLGGEVYLPRGRYMISTLILKKNVTIRGAGHNGTELLQITGTANWCMRSADAGQALTGVSIRDLFLNCFVNQSVGLGGILFEGVGQSEIVNVRIGGHKGSGIKILGGNTQGDSMHNVIDRCVFDNAVAAATAGVQLSPQGAGGSHPDGTRIVNCNFNSNNAVGILISPAAGDNAGWLGVDACVIAFNTIQSCPIPLDITGQGHKIISNRLEVTSGFMDIWVRAGTTNSPSIDNSFAFNTLAAHGSLVSITFHDLGTHTSRWMDQWSGSVVMQQLGGRYTTAGRPSAALLGPGGMYYDTTLSKPGFSDGTTWRDAEGSDVATPVIDLSQASHMVQITSASGSGKNGMRIVNDANSYALKLDQSGTGGVHDAVNIAANFAGAHSPFSVNSLNTTLSTVKIVNAAVQVGGAVIVAVGSDATRTAQIIEADNSGTGPSLLATQRAGATGVGVQIGYDAASTYTSRAIWVNARHTGGGILTIENASAQVAGQLISLVQNNAGATVPSIQISNAGSGDHLVADNFVITKSGQVKGAQFYNFASFNNARLQVNTTGSVIDRNVSDANPTLKVTNAHASNTGDTLQILGAGGVLGSRFDKNAYFVTKKSAAPADADLAAGDMALWFDSTNGAAKLMVKSKQADGTVRTGSLALA